jgi:hypothetical protein
MSNKSIDKEKLLQVSGQGSLIFTAPHTLYFKRLKSIHLPETNVKKIVKKLRNKLGEKNSKSITWNLLPDEKDLSQDDPNYLSINKLDNNIWYNTLKQISKEKKKQFVVDIHGMDNSHKYDIIIGLKSFRKVYGEYQYRKLVAILLEVFEPFKEKYNLRIGYNIIFQGYINKNYYTVSHMCNTLGFKAIQIELSSIFREKLVLEKILFKDFSKVLLETFSKYMNKKIKYTKKSSINKKKTSLNKKKSKK